MGIGKIVRGLGKVGLALEGLGYAVAAGRALVRAVKGRPSNREPTGDADVDIATRSE